MSCRQLIRERKKVLVKGMYGRFMQRTLRYFALAEKKAKQKTIFDTIPNFSWNTIS